MLSPLKWCKCMHPQLCIVERSASAEQTCDCNLTGVELMAIILKQKRLARQGALKALDFATTRFAPACERLINMAGLKVSLILGNVASNSPSVACAAGFQGQRRPV